MVEDIDLKSTWETLEECYYVQAGKGIQDSGCTTPVMGDKTWDKWLQLLQRKGLADRIEEFESGQTSEFGDGNILVGENA